MGSIVPISLFANITETRIVRSVIAASSAPGSTSPYWSTGRYVTRESLFFEIPACVEHRMVLDRGRDDVIALLPPGKRGTLDRPVVGLGPAGGEVDLLGTGPEGTGDLFPGFLDRFPCLAGDRIDRGRVPVLLLEIRSHRSRDFRMHRGCRRMVHVYQLVRLSPCHLMFLVPFLYIFSSYDLSRDRRRKTRGSRPLLPGSVCIRVGGTYSQL